MKPKMFRVFFQDNRKYPFLGRLSYIFRARKYVKISCDAFPDYISAFMPFSRKQINLKILKS